MTTDKPATAPTDSDIRLVADVLHKISGLSADVLTISRLPGGLTNRNYLVDSPPRRVVVRLSSAQAALLAIDREAEWANSVAAAAAGVAPAVLGYLPTASALDNERIDAETISAAALAGNPILAAVALTCRQLHARPEVRGG